MMKSSELSIFDGIIERTLGFCMMLLKKYDGSITELRFLSRLFLMDSSPELEDQQSSYKRPSTNEYY